MNSGLTIIVGAGPGNGLALGRRFHAEGHRIAMLARHTDNLERLRQRLPEAHYFSCDVKEPEQIHDVFTQIRQQLGTVSTLIYNAGAGAFGNVEDVTAEQFEAAWRVNALGCFYCVKEVLVDMRDNGHGNIIVIGATASVRGGGEFAAFSAAKGAQRNFAQSIARHLGPYGIHVAYVIIDGVIDMERTRAYFHDKPDEFFMQSDDIANTVFHLTTQPRSAWTFELDLRPFKEKW